MSKRKLLLADDSLTIQKVVNLTFADEDIEVVAVGDGNTAMDKFAENLPDLVMVDVNMPGFDGYKICETIKSRDETRHIPVILLVGSFERFNEEEARRVGADDYMTKPFQSIRQLVAKVTGLLDTAQDGAAPKATGQTNQTEDVPADTQDLTATSADADSFQAFDDRSAADVLVAADDYTTDEEDALRTQPLSADDLRRANAVYGGGSGGSAATATAFEENVYDFGEDDSAAGDAAENLPVGDSANSAEQTDPAMESFAGEQLPELDLQIGSTEVLSGQSPVKSPKSAFSAIDFDEDNLLELPFFDDAVSHNLEIETDAAIPAPYSRAAETVAAPPHSDRDEMTAIENSPALENPSPELIDRIAARAVEKISDRVIREIAREMVPRMADLIIREMAREKLNR